MAFKNFCFQLHSGKKVGMGNIYFLIFILRLLYYTTAQSEWHLSVKTAVKILHHNRLDANGFV